MNICALLVLFAGVVAGCDDDGKDAVRPSDTGVWTDADDEVYAWVRLDSLEWMTSNYKGGVRYWETYDYDNPLVYLGEEFDFSWDDDEVCEADWKVYGNLYSYEQATALAPGDGWRLPTDADWQCLERALGMSASDAASLGWRGSDEGVLIRQRTAHGAYGVSVEDGCGVALQLAGIADSGAYNENTLRSVGEAGYYWTMNSDTTQLKQVNVVYRKISSASSQIYRGQTVPNKLMRVRLVRTAGK